jgi:hypothetical protein
LRDVELGGLGGMMKRIVVNALWDGEARVWVATSEDVRGLAIEAETFEQLRDKVIPAIEDLIELNGVESDLAEIPVEIRSQLPARVLNPSQ